MPWKTDEDVEKHFKGLTPAQKTRWREVANDALARCEEKGGANCDASAIRQANSVVGRIAAQGFILHPVGEPDGFSEGAIEPIEARKGILAVMGDGEIVAFAFDARPPHNWTEANINGWLDKKIGSIRFNCAAPSMVSIPTDETDIPEPVKAAKQTLIASGADPDPMIVRIHQTTGRFNTGFGGKFNLSERFMRAFGPSYADKPAYEGHKGFRDTDARSRIGKILAFEERDGKFYFWLHVSAGRPDIKARIREDLALKKDNDEASGVQFSLEGWPTKVETDADGYHEPVDMDRQGKALALVEVAGATGTMIDRIAAKLAVQTITEEEQTMSEEKNTPLGVEDITKEEKFGEAFVASLTAYAETPLDEKNPLTPVIHKYLTVKAPELKAAAEGINAEAVAALSPAELRMQVVGTATKEEIPTLSAFGEAIKDLPADTIKTLPAFTEALNAMTADEIKDVPAVIEAQAAKGSGISEGIKAAMEVLKMSGAIPGMAGNPIIGMAAEEKKADREKETYMALVAKAKRVGFSNLPQDEADVLEPRLDYLLAKKLITL